jgi:hypothetical protein
VGTLAPASTRRHPRHRLATDVAIIEWAEPGADGPTVRSPVVTVSASGLAFQIEGRADLLPSGTALDGVSVRVGGCRIRGDVVVRNARELAPRRVEIGCLFYPTAEDEDRWMVLLSGFEAASHPREA